MTITTSPDLTKLLVNVTWDISGALPVIRLENLSAGTGLANVDYAFVATSPSGTLIHNGDINDPDESGVWSTTILNDAWPRPFNSVEWSGASYAFYVIAKDSIGNVYQTELQTATICRPYGNTQSSKNTYGVAASNVSVKCAEARIFFEDKTYHSYKGIDGTQISSDLKVIYPVDETGSIPSPFSISDYSTALVPISYSSSNYQFYQTTVYDYDLGNNTLVRIKYQTIQTFPVWCNIDLEPLVCEFNKLIDEVNSGNCADVAAANQKLNLISSKMFLVFMGIMQPLTGIDVPTLIEEIKVIGGFDCNCCSAATGIIPTTSSIIDGYNFIINPVCGDISGSVTVNGANITFNLQDISYVFKMFENSPSEITAFSIIPSENGCQKTYALAIDSTQLATDILNIITNDINLVNLFNTIVNNNTDGNFNLIVDGKCIIQTTTACDYTFDILNVPASVTYALLTGINASVVNFAFNETNLPALQAYINGLGLGTFVVTNPASGEVLIASTSNPNNLTGITYKVAGTSYVASMTKNCTGYTPKSANEVVQAMIDYLCGITDAEIATSQDYSICYVDPTTGEIKTVTVSSGAALTDFIIELLARGCDTVNHIVNLSSFTCTNIKALFPQSVNTLQPTDYILGTKNNDCARIYPIELGTRILELGVYDASFMAAFCAAMELCAGGKMCDPFDYLYLSFEESGSPSDVLYLSPFIKQITSADFTDATHYDDPDIVFGSPNPVVKVFWNDVPRFIYDGTDGTPLEWEYTATGINILIPGFDATSNDYNFMIFIDASVATSQGILTGEIIVNFSHPTAISYNIRYARIDNTSTPTYTTITGVLASPYTISPVADGQYNVCVTPIYADGRKCSEVCVLSPACTGITSFSAVLGGSPADDFVISYTAALGLPKIKVNINYPNGGFWSQIYVNDGMDIMIAAPPNVYGDYAISLTPVCNEDTGFEGAATAPVILTLANPVPVVNTATLTFSFVNAGGSFLNFQAALSIPIDGNISINEVFADGFTEGTCLTSAVSSAQKNTNMNILAGNNGVGANPEIISGVWASASHYSIYNVRINGIPCINGQTIAIGSFTVLLQIPGCN